MGQHPGLINGSTELLNDEEQLLVDDAKGKEEGGVGWGGKVRGSRWEHVLATALSRLPSRMLSNFGGGRERDFRREIEQRMLSIIIIILGRVLIPPSLGRNISS